MCIINIIKVINLYSQVFHTSNCHFVRKPYFSVQLATKFRKQDLDLKAYSRACPCLKSGIRVHVTVSESESPFVSVECFCELSNAKKRCVKLKSFERILKTQNERDESHRMI